MWLAAALAVAHAFWLWDQLPRRVIIHLNLWGEPDGWASRDVGLGAYLGAVLVLAASFGAADLSLARGNAEGVNVPHAEYWLAPERRDRSLRFVRRILRWFGLATFALVAATMHLVGRASLEPETPETVAFWPLIVAYLVVAFVVVAVPFRRFRAPPRPLDEA
jgi:hypothetical protein